jgi:hypothetical protein
MNLRLVAVVAATAVLSSVLSVGAARLSVNSAAQASPPAARTTTPSETDLLTEIADNTSVANGKLHVLGEDLQSILSEDKKVYSINYLSAKRLRYINTNLLALYDKFKSTFEYRWPKHTKSTVNENTLIEATLCSMDLWLQDQVLSDNEPQLPPCGGKG